MTHEEYTKALNQYRKELNRQDDKRSTGSVGKISEVMFRNDIMTAGISAKSDVRARGCRRCDARKGNTIRIEIKTGCGSVAYANDGEIFTTEDLTEEVILPKCAYVVWAPFVNQIFDVNHLTFEALSKNAWVFTREEFINTLSAIGKNGLKSSLHITKNGHQINIQTITPKMEERLWNILDNTQTYETWRKGL